LFQVDGTKLIAATYRFGHKFRFDRQSRLWNRWLLIKSKWFWVGLSLLALPVVSLVAVQIETNSGTSIGGGGYDLGPFVYSWALIIITAAWSLCALATALIHPNRATSIRSFGLTAIGAATFATVLTLYWKNLS
jgi:hypothetical protein